MIAVKGGHTSPPPRSAGHPGPQRLRPCEGPNQFDLASAFVPLRAGTARGPLFAVQRAALMVLSRCVCH
jgi:hypothetical protein